MTVKDDYEHCSSKVLEILADNNVDKDDVKAILGMLENAFFKLHESYASGRALERILENNGLYTKDYFKEYMGCYNEELQKYPWTVNDEKQDTEEDW